MVIDKLIKLYYQIEHEMQKENISLHVCGSFGIYLDNEYLQKNLVADKLISLKDCYFSSQYNCPRDIDFIGNFSDKIKIRESMLNNGFGIEKSLESIPGTKRNIFYKDDTKIDIFFDSFDFNHVIDLQNKIGSTSTRLEISKKTIPPTELLLQKLQIVEIGLKDLIGAWWIFQGNEIRETTDNGINLEVITHYLKNDWGFYHTVKKNLELIIELCLNNDVIDNTFQKIELFKTEIENIPKSLKWQMRSKIGTKIRWFTVVENI